MVITTKSLKRFIATLEIVLVFFSSTCLWSEVNIKKYLVISILVLGIAFASSLIFGINIYKTVNNRYILWVCVLYSIFEVYGLLFLRIGEFNWDFVLFSGILQIALTLVLMQIDDKDDLIKTFCTACKWALLLVCLYMVFSGSLTLSDISFGSRLGDELSGNVNTVATNIGIMLVPAVYLLFLPCETRCSRVSSSGIVILATLCMGVTGSKKGLLVLAIIFIMYFLIEKKTIKFLIFPLVSIGVIYAIFNVSFLYNTIGFRVVDMFATLGMGTSVTKAQSTVIRDDLIKEGLKSFWNHPILGGGMNYFQFINHARYYSHNNYVEILNNMGILGLLLYYVPFVNVARKLIIEMRTYYLDDAKRKLYIFLLAYLSVKFILDFAMVSYTALCTFTIPFLFVFEIYRREKEERKLM